MLMKLFVLAWDKHTNMGELNQLMVSKLSHTIRPQNFAAI
jgi:hypothetical protein